MPAPLEHGHRHFAQSADHDSAFVPLHGRKLEVGNFVVGNALGIFDTSGEGAEAAAAGGAANPWAPQLYEWESMQEVDFC
jgi:hypothetical protein